jgi:hypothetical protein
VIKKVIGNNKKRIDEVYFCDGCVGNREHRKSKLPTIVDMEQLCDLATTQRYEIM